jgi:phosphatidate cytidylyltransferase
MLRLRLIVGLSLAALLIALLLVDAGLSARVLSGWRGSGLGPAAGRWLGNGAIATLVIGVLVWLAARELVQFARRLDYRPAGGLAQVGAVLLSAWPFVVFNLPSAARPGDGWILLLLGVVLALAFWAQAQRHGTERVIINVGSTLLIVLYLGGLAHFLTRLRMEVGGPAGVALVLLSVTVVKLTDTGAYFTGRLLGRHKLIEWLSPKKTWEGLVGGVLVAVGASVALGEALHYADIVLFESPFVGRLALLLGFGVLMAALSVAGDLCASLLKRDAAVKDSGDTLPGLGGVVDVLDSPLLAAPVAWLIWTQLLQQGVITRGPA